MLGEGGNCLLLLCSRLGGFFDPPSLLRNNMKPSTGKIKDFKQLYSKNNLIVHQKQLLLYGTDIKSVFFL